MEAAFLLNEMGMEFKEIKLEWKAKGGTPQEKLAFQPPALF